MAVPIAGTQVTVLCLPGVRTTLFTARLGTPQPIAGVAGIVTRDANPLSRDLVGYVDIEIRTQDLIYRPFEQFPVYFGKGWHFEPPSLYTNSFFRFWLYVGEWLEQCTHSTLPLEL